MTVRLLSPKEAAKLLEISMATLYRIKDSGQLPFYKMGGGIRFEMNDIEQYLASCRVELIRNDNVCQKNTQ